MLKKTINYTDYDGNERSEEFLFNLTKTELMKMELSKEGGMEKFIQKIINTQDSKQIMQIFEEIILMSYGVKSDDGKRFIKSDELREAFSQTEAYNELFFELATNTEEATKFINGVIPAGEIEAATKQLSGNKPAIAAVPSVTE